MKKTKMFMLVLTSAVLALTPVTANAAEAAPSQVTETVIATPTPTPKKPQKKGFYLLYCQRKENDSGSDCQPPLQADCSRDHQFQHVQIPEASDMFQLGDQGLL